MRDYAVQPCKDTLFVPNPILKITLSKEHKIFKSIIENEDIILALREILIRARQEHEFAITFINCEDFFVFPLLHMVQVILARQFPDIKLEKEQAFWDATNHAPEFNSTCPGTLGKESHYLLYAFADHSFYKKTSGSNIFNQLHRTTQNAIEDIMDALIINLMIDPIQVALWLKVGDLEHRLKVAPGVDEKLIKKALSEQGVFLFRYLLFNEKNLYWLRWHFPAFINEIALKILSNDQLVKEASNKGRPLRALDGCMDILDRQIQMLEENTYNAFILASIKADNENEFAYYVDSIHEVLNVAKSAPETSALCIEFLLAHPVQWNRLIEDDANFYSVFDFFPTYQDKILKKLEDTGAYERLITRFYFRQILAKLNSHAKERFKMDFAKLILMPSFTDEKKFGTVFWGTGFYNAETLYELADNFPDLQDEMINALLSYPKIVEIIIDSPRSFSFFIQHFPLHRPRILKYFIEKRLDLFERITCSGAITLVDLKNKLGNIPLSGSRNHNIDNEIENDTFSYKDLVYVHRGSVMEYLFLYILTTKNQFIRFISKLKDIDTITAAFPQYEALVRKQYILFVLEPTLVIAEKNRDSSDAYSIDEIKEILNKFPSYKPRIIKELLNNPVFFENIICGPYALIKLLKLFPMETSDIIPWLLGDKSANPVLSIPLPEKSFRQYFDSGHRVDEILSLYPRLQSLFKRYLTTSALPERLRLFNSPFDLSYGIQWFPEMAELLKSEYKENILKPILNDNKMYIEHFQYAENFIDVIKIFPEYQNTLLLKISSDTREFQRVVFNIYQLKNLTSNYPSYADQLKRKFFNMYLTVDNLPIHSLNQPNGLSRDEIREIGAIFPEYETVCQALYKFDWNNYANVQEEIRLAKKAFDKKYNDIEAGYYADSFCWLFNTKKHEKRSAPEVEKEDTPLTFSIS